MGKKENRLRKERPKKPHGHECGICGKPRRYRLEEMERSTRRAIRDYRIGLGMGEGRGEI